MTNGGSAERGVVHTPDPALGTPDDRAVERFLQRVAALGPAEWGRLDAAGQRLLAGDPIARWERARRLAALAAVPPLLEALLASVGFAASAVEDLARWLSQEAEPGHRRPALRGLRPGRRVVVGAGPPPHPRWERFARQLEELWDTAAARPGGPEPAHTCLEFALLALRFRDSLPPESFARLYAPVEPVIPAASLR